MMQQINLYLPEFRPRRVPLRTTQMLAIAFAFLLLLLFATYSGYQKNKQLRAQAETQRAQVEQLKAQLNNLTLAQPQKSLADLEKESEEVQQELLLRQRLLSVVSSNNLGNTGGFSTQLSAMSRQSDANISLSAFSFSRGGRYAEFIGQASSSDQVPLYLQRLRNEESFNEVAFGVLRIEPSVKNSGLVDFSLAAQAEDEKRPRAEKTQVQLLLEEILKAGDAN